MSTRRLTQEEITALKGQGCRAGNWQAIRVADPFAPTRIQNVSFSGAVSIGRLSGQVTLPGGLKRSCGLYNSRIHDCTFGDNVFVSDVGVLANYDLEEGVEVYQVDSLVVEGESRFGNGTRISILNEAGGRELPIYDRLSAQIAYLLVMYRHNPEMVRTLETLIDAYTAKKSSDRGRIQKGSRLLHCGRLRNLSVGPGAAIEGALKLEEGTVTSCPEDPSRVGTGVMARNFLLLSGSHVESAAMLENCFVGQGVRIGKQFSAEECTFFANCEGFHGEALSVFAGPYTVTHHKSTLLIAGYFSFFNAGSGSNQSNHMYKLGPLHQGILERGTKTGSFSYLNWPVRVGAFTVVVGKHSANLDTSELPFSKLMEKEGVSLLIPATNLVSIGTWRDAAKWVARDRRKDPDRLDLIHFSLLNPYTVGGMIRGKEVLHKLAEDTSKTEQMVSYKGVQIRRPMLESYAGYYEMGIDVYLGESLAQRLEPLCPKGTIEDVHRTLSLRPSGAKDAAVGKWRDICGFLAPAADVEEIVASLATEKIENLEELELRLRRLYDRYPEGEWAWCVGQLEQRLGSSFEKLGARQLAAVVRSGTESALKLNSMLVSDAGKEFDDHHRVGFGIDGAETERDRDFEAVRGSLKENVFVRKIREQAEWIDKRNSRLIAWLEKLSGS